jgi:hypothetical protein
MLTEPLAGLTAWTDHLARIDLPILRRTARAVQVLRTTAEATSARTLAETIGADPLATMRLFAFVARRRGARQVTEITSIEGCVLMAGVPPLLDDLNDAPTIESSLRGRPEALRGLLRVVRRARHAARLAWQFGVWKHDQDPGALATAALLHEFTEMLVWSSAPTLALCAARTQHERPDLPRSAVQQSIMGLDLNELQFVLARLWHLPELYVTMMHDAAARHPRERLVMHAIVLARHLADDREHPALAEDYQAIAELLHTTVGRVRDLIHPGEATPRETRATTGGETGFPL